MKKFLCIIMALVMIFSLAACGKKIVVNKKPHVEPGDMVYDPSEIIVNEETFSYCGVEYEIADLAETLLMDYNSEDAINIVCKEAYTDSANNLALSLEEMGFAYTINGVSPEENTSEEETSTVVAE